jgi:hypothetical protein
MVTTGESIRRRVRIVGRVQGVGFRESCRREALLLGVASTARTRRREAWSRVRSQKCVCPTNFTLY